MFTKVLIANRGAIACRIIHTLQAMGIQSVAIYAEADADSLDYDFDAPAAAPAEPEPLPAAQPATGLAVASIRGLYKKVSTQRLAFKRCTAFGLLNALQKCAICS